MFAPMRPRPIIPICIARKTTYLARRREPDPTWVNHKRRRYEKRAPKRSS